MTHSSIMPMDYHGQRQYIYCTTGGVVGVSAERRQGALAEAGLEDRAGDGAVAAGD